MAKVKITSATMINGSAVVAGQTIDVADSLARDLMRRGRAVPAGEQVKADEQVKDDAKGKKDAE